MKRTLRCWSHAAIASHTGCFGCIAAVVSHVATPRSSLPLENAGHSGHRIDEVSQRGARHEGLLQVRLALRREEQCRQCRSQPAMPPLIWQGQLSGRENNKQGPLSLPGVWLAGAMPRQPPTPELPPVDKEASTAGSGQRAWQCPRIMSICQCALAGKGHGSAD